MENPHHLTPVLSKTILSPYSDVIKQIDELLELLENYS